MSTCFVIQPFDGGPFDKRYEDTLAPAIRAADIEPYRVDRDESAVIPIENIEAGIRKADVCLADISTDNPNVWFEVGFAIAGRKPIVLVCSHERSKFPFDVQHRSIIRYKTESKSDFSELADKVTKRLRASIDSAKKLATISELSPIANTEGLSSHEMAALVIIAQSINEAVTRRQFVDEMNRAGFTDIAAALSLRSLSNREYVEAREIHEFNSEPYTGYFATEAGFRWLETNQSKLTLHREPPDPF